MPTDPSLRLPVSKNILTFGLFFTVFIFVHYLCESENVIQSFPFHHDDFDLLALVPNWQFLGGPRPVAWTLFAIFSLGGHSAYYAALNVLTVSYPALVTIFLFRFFRLRATVVGYASAAIIAFSAPTIVDSTKYLGLIIDPISANFAILAVLLLTFRPRTYQRVVSAGFAVFYAFAVFTKEDVLFPPLLIAGYEFFRSRRESTDSAERNGRAALNLAIAASVVVLWVPYNFVIAKSPFNGGGAAVPTDPYFISLSPASVISVYWQYISASAYSLALFIVAGLSSLVLLFLFSSEQRLRLVLIIVCIMSLIGPYALLPNHVFAFYGCQWEPWLAGIVAACSLVIVQRVASFSRSLARLGGLASLSLCAWGCLISEPLRERSIHWYRSQADGNRAIIQGLTSNRGRLNRFPEVGIVGLDPQILSPWLKPNPLYFAVQLHLTPRWVLFFPTEGGFYKFSQFQNAADPVSIRPLSEICSNPDRPILRLRPNESPTLRRVRECRKTS